MKIEIPKLDVRLTKEQARGLIEFRDVMIRAGEVMSRRMAQVAAELNKSLRKP